MSEPNGQRPPLPHVARDKAMQAEKERREKVIQARRDEYLQLAANPAFERWMVRQLIDLDGRGQTLKDEVFSLHSNEMIRKEARRELAQKFMDEMFEVAPDLYRRIDDLLMRVRSEGLVRKKSS